MTGTPQNSLVLPATFYERSTLLVAKELLGKYLCHRLPTGEVYAGYITETEAYLGPEDRASHARFVKKRDNQLIPSPRSSVLFGPSGRSYVYLIYGVHYCFNAVAHPKEEVGAVLVRSVVLAEPLFQKNTAIQGPGRVCKMLQIDRRCHGFDLTQEGIASFQGGTSPLWIEDRGFEISEAKILTAPRVGVDYAGEHASLPYRFIYTPK